MLQMFSNLMKSMKRMNRSTRIFARKYLVLMLSPVMKMVQEKAVVRNLMKKMKNNQKKK